MSAQLDAWSDWKAPPDEARLKLFFRKMVPFKGPNGILDPVFTGTQSFPNDVMDHVSKNEKLCSISKGTFNEGNIEMQGNKSVQQVQVTWLNGTTQDWKLILYLETDNNPVIVKIDGVHQRAAIFVPWGEKVTEDAVKIATGHDGKSGPIRINGWLGANMSRPWLGSEREGGIASLACMRAALEAADGGAGGGLEKLGVRLQGAKLPVPQPVNGVYQRQQFTKKDLQEARDNIGKHPFTEADAAYTKMLQAWGSYKDQDHVVATQQKRREREAALFEEDDRRRRGVDALVVDDVPEWGSGRAAGGAAYGRAYGDDDVLEITEVEAGADAERRGAAAARRLRDAERAEREEEEARLRAQAAAARRRRERAERAHLERAERGELPPSGLARAWEMEKDDIDWPTLDDWYRDGLSYPKRRRF
jgi:hypothetical protein